MNTHYYECFLFSFVHTTNVNLLISKGVNCMSRRKGIMSSRLKEEIAKELGFYDVVEREGWGGIKSRDAGNMVKRAIEMAQEGLAQQNQNNMK